MRLPTFGTKTMITVRNLEQLVSEALAVALQEFHDSRRDKNGYVKSNCCRSRTRID